MSMHWPKAGPNDAASYVIPGVPWVSGTTLPATTIVHYSFPAATRELIVRNTTAGSTVAVGFSANGMNTVFRKFFTLTGVQELKLEVRVKDLFLSASVGTPAVEVIAGLSQVLYADFPILTGSVSGVGNIPLFNGIG